MGFFGDLWGGVKGAVGGFITGGPIGAIGGAVGGAVQAHSDGKDYRKEMENAMIRDTGGVRKDIKFETRMHYLSDGVIIRKQKEKWLSEGRQIPNPDPAIDLYKGYGVPLELTLLDSEKQAMQTLQLQTYDPALIHTMPPQFNMGTIGQVSKIAPFITPDLAAAAGRDSHDYTQSIAPVNWGGMRATTMNDIQLSPKRRTVAPVQPDNKMWLYIGGGFLALIAIIFAVKKR